MGGVLFVADPFSNLNPESDSSLALARGFLQRGWKVYWTTDEGIHLLGEKPLILSDEILQAPVGEFPRTAPRRIGLEALKIIAIRKDPPFDAGYVGLCWKLLPFESELQIFNAPSRLLQFHEKLIPLLAVRWGFLKAAQTLATFWGDATTITEFTKSNPSEDYVVKPVLGHGGRGVLKVSRRELLTHALGRDWLVQPYSPEITTRGDRRVIFLNGEVIGSFVRFPKKGSFVSNLAQGGVPRLVPLSPDQKKICERLGAFLKVNQLQFAGADLIGGRLSEVNITSPTGLRTLEALDGDDRSSVVVEFLERQQRRREVFEPGSGTLPESQIWAKGGAPHRDLDA